MVASAVVSFATSLKLPLSTTYVTFMVAMGTSLSDQAWGRESAVYRITGVLTVIGGWFFTAFVAFSVSFIFAFILHYLKLPAIIGLVVIAFILIVQSYRWHFKKEKESKTIEDFSLKDVTEADHAAMFWAVWNGAQRRGISFGRQLRAYGRGMHGTSARARWVRGLTTGPDAPDGWDEALAWEPYREAYGRVLARAATDLVYAPPNPCNGKPRHWGSPWVQSDRARALRAVRDGRWRPLRCVAGGDESENRFFEVNRRPVREVLRLFI